MDGQLPGLFDTDQEQLKLRSAFLSGFPKPLPSSESGIQWEIAKAWNDELDRCGAQSPNTIKGIANSSGVYWFSEQLCPFSLSNEFVMRRGTEEELKKRRQAIENLLIEFLGSYGF